MKRSLQRHLSLMLGGAVLLAGLLAALASFLLAYSEAREFQDDMLRQIATLAPLDTAAGQLRPSTDLDDPESRLLVLHLPHDLRPEWLASGLRPGFHTLDANAGRLRVYLRDSAAGGRTVVAQATETRDELAINSALRTLIPLLLLLPVLAWLIVHIVRGELAPIARLSRTLDEQPVDRPQAIADSLPE
jgi:two-component system OmpR family sensor kinase